MLWMQQKLLINWVFIIYDKENGTLKLLVQPLEKDCTKVWTGCLLNCKTPVKGNNVQKWIHPVPMFTYSYLFPILKIPLIWLTCGIWPFFVIQAENWAWSHKSQEKSIYLIWKFCFLVFMYFIVWFCYKLPTRCLFIPRKI